MVLLLDVGSVVGALTAHLQGTVSGSLYSSMRNPSGC